MSIKEKLRFEGAPRPLSDAYMTQVARIEEDNKYAKLGQDAYIAKLGAERAEWDTKLEEKAGFFRTKNEEKIKEQELKSMSNAAIKARQSQLQQVLLRDMEGYNEELAIQHKTFHTQRI